VKKPSRTLATRFVVPLLMVTLGACGSDKDADTDATSAGASAHGDGYCSTLKGAGWQVLSNDYLALNNAADFADLRTNIRELESAAPVEVKAAWGVMGDDYDRFTELMDDAGLSINELLYWDDNGKLPASVDQKQFAQFFRKVRALDYTKVAEATDTIVTHAKTECVMGQPPVWLTPG